MNRRASREIRQPWRAPKRNFRTQHWARDGGAELKPIQPSGSGRLVRGPNLGPSGPSRTGPTSKQTPPHAQTRGEYFACREAWTVDGRVAPAPVDTSCKVSDPVSF